MLLPLLQNLGMLGTVGDQPATFVGPNIATLTLTLNKVMTARNFAPRFESDLAMTFTVVGTLPVGLSLSSAGVLSGTPTVLGTSFPVVIRATDENLDTADSNAFAIIITASAGSGDIGGSNIGGADIGGPDVGGPDINTPGWWVS